MQAAARRASRRAHAHTSRPTTAVAAPTYPVEVKPKPALIAIPPSHGTSALAALNAEWLDAAAIVCAPAATAIRCDSRLVPIAPLVPTPPTPPTREPTQERTRPGKAGGSPW